MNNEMSKKNNLINFSDVLNKNELEVNKSDGDAISNEFSENDFSDLTFKIENFEGPLDLLLHLIKKSKLGIEEVKLSLITEQYLEIMKQIDKVDLEIASDFIEVAASLIEIKSKALLPKLILTEEDEEDPEMLLLQRLNEYKLFKETCEQLKLLENVERFYKKPEPDANKYRIVLKDMNLDMLLDALSGILHRVSDVEINAKPKEVVKEIFTVSNKIQSIKEALINKTNLTFYELFEQSSSRDEVITTFLALLELLKLQEVKVCQGDVFQDIQIYKADEIVNG